MANILFVNKLSPKSQGGAETRIREVAHRLQKAGHRVFVICGRTRLDEPFSEDDEGVHIRYVTTLPKFILKWLRPGHYLPQAMFYLVAAPAILGSLKAWKIDVIRDSISPFPGLGLLAPFLARRAVAVTHILYRSFSAWRRYYGAVYGLAGYLFERLLVAGWLPYRCLMTDSRWLASDLASRVTLGLTIRPVLNGIDCRLFAKRSSDGGPALRILCVARFSVHKRQAVLLDACVLLRDSGQAFEVTLVGDGPLRTDLERRTAALGLGGSVRFLGALPHTRMASIYAEHDVLVITSESEGLPVAILEAMASRLPVIAPDVPYVGELTPDIADMLISYALGDPHSLASAIRMSQDHPRETACKEAKAWDWIQALTWEEVASAEWQEMSSCTRSTAEDGRQHSPIFRA